MDTPSSFSSLALWVSSGKKSVPQAPSSSQSLAMPTHGLPKPQREHKQTCDVREFLQMCHQKGFNITARRGLIPLLMLVAGDSSGYNQLTKLVEDTKLVEEPAKGPNKKTMTSPAACYRETLPGFHV